MLAAIEAQAAIDATYGGRSLEQSLKDLDDYEAEQKQQDENPQGAPPSEDIPASESITGEAISLENETEAMSPISQETGEMVIPQGQTLQTEEDGRGKGLINGQFIEEADGSITGTAHVADLDICADVPQYKKKQSAAGRTAADKDGTTHELSGGWNHLASPIHVWRRANGKLEVISGRHRLAHAKKNGIDKLQVRVYEETETQNTEWAKLHDVELNILDNTCNAIDIAFFFRNNPMSEAEAESRGLMPKTLVGAQTAASRIGLTIANKACDDVYTALINGQCTAEEAYTCCNIANTEAGQKLALEQRQQSKKTSWEYVTAYVRQAEQIQYSSKQLDLFGNDIGWQDEAEKVAKYTSRARTQIKDRINLLRSSQRVEKRQDIAKELGVEIKTPEDASKLIGNLLILDSQYEHLDPTLAISTKAQEWDGTSQIKLDLSAGSSFSINTLKRASDAFEQVDKQEPIFIDVPEARDEDMKTVKARMRKALDEMRQAGGFLLSGKYHVNITTLGFKEVAHHVGNRKNAEIFCKLPEVAKHARFMYSAKNTDAGKRSKQDIKRFHYYLSKIIDSAGHEYYVLLNIAEKNDGSLFYDLDNELSIDVITTKSTVIDLPRARIPNAGLTNNEGAFMSRLQHTYAAVKHYRENNQNNSSFSLSLTPQQQERTPQFFNWFGDWVNTPKEASKVVDSDGSPLVVYHGSIDEFTIFDKDKASAESNVGAGFYFTNNAEDVAANYAGGGPDFNNKVVLLAERKADEEDIDYDKAKEIIEQELIKTDKTFEVYLDIKNPVYIGKNETCITYGDVIEDYMAKDDYDEDHYYDGAAEYVQDNIINEAIDKMDVDYDNIDGISSAVFELLSEEALTFENLKEKLDELYLEDSNGNLYGSEATRIIFEEFGYDGIIDNSVSTKFRSMGLSSGTVHYIVFKPNQIKSATDNNGDFNRGNPDITYSLTTFADMAAGEHSRKTDIALSLIRHADAELRRWSRLFSGIIVQE